MTNCEMFGVFFYMSGRDVFEYTTLRLESSLVGRAEKNYIPLNIDLWITSVDYEEIAAHKNKYNIEADQVK